MTPTAHRLRVSLKNKVQLIFNILAQFGFAPRTFFDSIRGLPRFIQDAVRYKSMAGSSRHAIPIGGYYPVIHERYKQSGEARGHYFHQDLWAARKIFKRNPSRHIDVGSSISGFVSHILAFREIEVIDIRPLESEIPGLTFIQGDAPFLRDFADDSLESISTLHAGEHFGLGRYGDPIDPDAHFNFMRSLSRVLKPGGRLYYAVPCGEERLYFNAHRVLSPRTVLHGFSGLTLISFACVKDDGKLYDDCSVETVEHEKFGCGLFEFSKS